MGFPGDFYTKYRRVSHTQDEILDLTAPSVDTSEMETLQFRIVSKNGFWSCQSSAIVGFTKGRLFGEAILFAKLNSRLFENHIPFKKPFFSRFMPYY